MKTVIIVSKCLKLEKDTAHFHFKGVCAGETIKKVTLTFKKDFKLKKGTEYLMYVKLTSMENKELKGEIIKAKKLEDAIGA